MQERKEKKKYKKRPDSRFGKTTFLSRNLRWKSAEKRARRHKQKQAENPKTSNEFSLLINKHIETKNRIPPIAYNTKQNRI